MKKVIEWCGKLWKEEEGLGTLEILLIVAVLVAIAIVFRKWITYQLGFFKATLRY